MPLNDHWDEGWYELTADQKFDRLHWQTGRLVSDRVSEKETTARVNKDRAEREEKLDNRIRLIERHQNIGFGVVVTAQVVIAWLIAAVGLFKH